VGGPRQEWEAREQEQFAGEKLTEEQQIVASFKRCRPSRRTPQTTGMDIQAQQAAIEEHFDMLRQSIQQLRLLAPA